MSENPNRWLHCYRPRPQTATKLICFPHSGGAASAYRTWPDRAGRDLEIHVVQYPGREERLQDPVIDTMDTLVDAIVTEMAGVHLGRFALFGHSMGGAVAYEVAVRLRALGMPEPVHLFVSGRQPPEHHRIGDVHTKDDADLIRELIRLRPANAELLSEPELAQIILPIIRNDYHLIETYQPQPAPPLGYPITALIGEDDTELTVDEAADWSLRTTCDAHLEVFPGDHFYLVDHRQAVIDTVTDALRHAQTISGTEGPNL